jgi:hypothetical protein
LDALLLTRGIILISITHDFSGEASRFTDALITNVGYEGYLISIEMICDPVMT